MAHRLIKGGELYLYGSVGMSGGFESLEVIDALLDIDGDVTVHINSGGGFASEGRTIFNALKARDDSITVLVDGDASSAASIIAMSGDEIVMREGATMMVHNASALTLGTADDHEKSIEMLRREDDGIARIYANRTGLPLADVKALMDAETWMTAAEAVKKGFATSKTREKAARPTAFDYRKYQHPPERFVAMAMAWARGGVFAAEEQPAETPAPTGQHGEPNMANDTGGSDKPAATILQTEHDAALAAAKTEAEAAGRKAANERLSAIMASDKIKGRESTAAKWAAKFPQLSADEVVDAMEDIPEPAAHKPLSLADRQAQRPQLDSTESGHLELTKPHARADLVADMKRRHGIAA